MLKERVLTAIVLAAVLLGVMLGLPPVATVWLLTVLVLIGAWEWAGFIGKNTPATRAAFTVAVALALVACLYFYTSYPDFVLVIVTVAVAWWFIAFLWLCLAPGRVTPVTAALAGFLSLVPCWLALVHVTFTTQSTRWALFTLALVWAGDTGAFFVGRWLGRVPLAPRVSPKKTWEGALGGVASERRRCLGFGEMAVRPGRLAVRDDLRRGGGTFDRRRPDGKHVEARRRPQGQRHDVPRSRRHAGSHRQRDRCGTGAGIRAHRPQGHHMKSDGVKGVAILGSTGSVGEHTLDVIARHPDRFRVVALGANRNVEKLADQCLRFSVPYAALADPAAAARLEGELRARKAPTQVIGGVDALVEIAGLPEVDSVMAAIVGAAGLRSTLAAARAGKRLLLANKESLVMAGPLLMQTVRNSGATLLPIDSEHNAVFQCLPPNTRCGEAPPGVKKILLTASGGPFLDADRARLDRVTPDEACAHPNWVMGRKISVDSATLMNKGLEFIEACLLFSVRPDQVEVVIHRESIVHSLVEYVDGSMLAQLGAPDMRTPIAHALAWPERVTSGVQSLDLVKVGHLRFEAPDLRRFPALALAQDAALAGGLRPASLNAANEVAVSAFLEGGLNFARIPAVIESVMATTSGGEIRDLNDVLAADAEARERAFSFIRPRAVHA